MWHVNINPETIIKPNLHQGHMARERENLANVMCTRQRQWKINSLSQLKGSTHSSIVPGRGGFPGGPLPLLLAPPRGSRRLGAPLILGGRGGRGGGRAGPRAAAGAALLRTSSPARRSGAGVVRVVIAVVNEV